MPPVARWLKKPDMIVVMQCPNTDTGMGRELTDCVDLSSVSIDHDVTSWSCTTSGKREVSKTLGQRCNGPRQVSRTRLHGSIDCCDRIVLSSVSVCTTLTHPHRTPRTPFPPRGDMLKCAAHIAR